jgi:hypothetical protein
VHSLELMSNHEPTRGEFDPANEAEVERLMRAATHRYGGRLALLPASQRQEVEEAARFGAIEAALLYDAAEAKTTKWKTAANRANTIVRKFFRELPQRPQNETDVLQRIRRKGNDGDADSEGDAGELDLTVLAADDDDDDEYDGLSDEQYDALVREEDGLLAATAGEAEAARDEVEPTEEELNPLLRASDEDAEHFEMRRRLLATAREPDRTILRHWTLPATETGQLLGLSGDAVRQRKTRLRRLIDKEIARPDPLPSTPPQDA